MLVSKYPHLLYFSNYIESIINRFEFCGRDNFTNKKGDNLIVFDENGVNAKESFFIFDSNGQIFSTNEPYLLKNLYKSKASINFHIKMWAEGRRDFTLSKVEFLRYCRQNRFPLWVFKAVEAQRWKGFDIREFVEERLKRSAEIDERNRMHIGCSCREHQMIWFNRINAK